MSDRLDQIEAILLQVSQQQQINTEAINQLQQSQLALQESIARVDHHLQESVTDLVNMIVQTITDAGVDREAFQAEIRRIWEYLLQQGGNGRG